MDVVLVGLPGSGKTSVGRRLAARHGASFIDLDETIEAGAGRSIPDIFSDEGETGFRARERAAIAGLGPADPAPRVVRVIATGGGAVVDPRNRWALYRDRIPVWLDGRPEVLAQRLRNSRTVRPLVQGRDPIAAIRQLTAARTRFYAPAIRVQGVAEVSPVVATVDAAVREVIGQRAGNGSEAGAAGPGPAGGGAAWAHGTVLLRAETPIGVLTIGTGIAGTVLASELRRIGASRAIVVTEPAAWAAVGELIAPALAAAGLPLELVVLPQGEDAKRLSVVEDAARQLARLRVERRDPIVAVGGGAVGDTAGFLAATYLRGIPFVQVPTTLVAQIDSSIGGKTGVDLPEGKNLVGAFHQPAMILTDVALLATLPDRERRAALAEAVKMAALGDERLFGLLEDEGRAIAGGDLGAFDSGAVAELVERTAWAKVEVVSQDEHEAAGRIALNLGHSLGHAFEAAGGYGDLRHGEAVAFGLRAACRIGVEMEVTPRDRAARIERLLDLLELGLGRLPYRLEDVLDHLASDKKHAAGRLRWVLPSATGHVVRDDVPEAVVGKVAGDFLAHVPVA